MIDEPLRSRVARWIREPLLHFLVAAVLLFVAYRALAPAGEVRETPARITLTDDDLNQMTVAWRAQGRSPPSAEQLRSLIDSKVREEILYREALALGLDKDDTIVKRRLAQKMDFLAEDISSMRDPGAGELRAWFDARAARFAATARISFQHVYFSPDTRGANARQDAARALARIQGKPVDVATMAAPGDPFMFQAYYADRTPEQVARVFGTEFANAILDSRAGVWVGPLESGLGWHLVHVTTLSTPRVPAFEEVEADVRTEWMSEQRTVAKKRMYESMRARYEVVLPRDFPAVSATKAGQR
jgi:peptidyl-prolyl cis-trans isomerase C